MVSRDSITTCPGAGSIRDVDRLELLGVIGGEVAGLVAVAVEGAALDGAVLEDAGGYGGGRGFAAESQLMMLEGGRRSGKRKGGVGNYPSNSSPRAESSSSSS